MDNSQALELLGRIAKRDQGAFRELYDAHSRRLYAYALNQIRDPAHAEDIVADTFYEIWRNPSRFQGKASFASWILGIARNKIVLAVRSRAVGAIETSDEVDEMISGAESPTGAFEQKERRELVDHCMTKLTAEHRESILLVFYEGYSLSEVAAIQGAPEATVKTRLFHARHQLQRCLRGFLGEPLPEEANRTAPDGKTSSS